MILNTLAIIAIKNKENSNFGEFNKLAPKIKSELLNTHSDISDTRKLLESTGLVHDELFKGKSRKFYTSK